MTVLKNAEPDHSGQTIKQPRLVTPSILRGPRMMRREGPG